MRWPNVKLIDLSHIRGARRSFWAATAAVLSISIAPAAPAQSTPASPTAAPTASEPSNTAPLLTKAQLALVLATLADAQTEGLPRKVVAADSATAEVTAAILSYARDVHVGRLEPSGFAPVSLRPPARLHGGGAR